MTCVPVHCPFPVPAEYLILYPAKSGSGWISKKMSSSAFLVSITKVSIGHFEYCRSVHIFGRCFHLVWSLLIVQQIWDYLVMTDFMRHFFSAISLSALTVLVGWQEAQPTASKH